MVLAVQYIDYPFATAALKKSLILIYIIYILLSNLKFTKCLVPASREKEGITTAFISVYLEQ